MKKIIIVLVLAIISGCQNSSLNKANKYTLLYSNDRTANFDSSSFVSFDEEGKITDEKSFDGTLFTQLTKYQNKVITNNGQEIVELINDEIKITKYEKQLKAYSSELESFEFKNKLFWFVHGGEGGIYNSYLYCYDTKESIAMPNGAVFGYLLDENNVYVVMGNDWHNEDESKNTAMRTVKIDLERFQILEEFVSDISPDITMNLLEQGENVFDKNEILFSIKIPDEESDKNKNASYLYSFSISNRNVKKILNLSEFGIDNGEDETYYINNSFIYNQAIYFFLRNGDLFKISKDGDYHVEKVLTLSDCLVGSLATYRVIKNHLVCVYRKNVSENNYSLVEYNLDNYNITDDLLLEEVKSLLSKKGPVGILKE